MSSARYFVPDHPSLTDVYSKEELRDLLQSNSLSRSDIVWDDVTGKSHLLGDLIASPYPSVTIVPAREVESPMPERTQPERPPLTSQEFRAPLKISPYRNGNTRRSTGREEDLDDDDDVNEEDEEWIEAEENYEEDDEESDLVHRRAPSAEGRTLRGVEPRSSVPDVVFFDDDDNALEEDENEDDPVVSRPPPEKPVAEKPAEDILYIGHPAWLAYPRALLGAVCFAAALAYCWRLHLGFEWLTLLGSVSGLFLLFISLDRSTTTYIVTSRRVELETGILGRSTTEVQIQDIRAIDVHQKGYGSLMGMGHVHFDSSASAGPEVSFRHIHRPHRVKDLVRDLQLQVRV